MAKPSNPKDIIGSDKLPMGLVPDTVIAYASLGFLEGMLKYGLVNWRAMGVRISIYMDACKRHLAKFQNGEWEDPQTKVPHLASALACIGIILDAHVSGKLEDDRPLCSPTAELIDSLSENVKHLKKLHGDKDPFHYTQIAVDAHIEAAKEKAPEEGPSKCCNCCGEPVDNCQCDETCVDAISRDPRF